MNKLKAMSLASLLLCQTALLAQPNLLELKAQGDQAFKEKDWKTYQTVYEALTTSTPENGTYWSRLYYAHYRQGQYDKAIAAAQEAINIGHKVNTNEYNIASAYALKGDKEAAITHYLKARANKLRNAEQTLTGDSDWKVLLEDQEVRKAIYPKLEDNAARSKRWHTDIDFLSKRAEEAHHSLYDHITKSEWLAEIASIKAEVDDSSDMQIRAALTKLIVRIGDGHSLLYPRFAGKDADQLLPLGFYKFSDGVFVTAAKPDYLDLRASKLLAIEGIAIDEVYERLAPFISRDNPMNLLWVSTQSLSFGWMLEYAGIIDDPKHIEMTFERDGKTFTREIHTSPFKGEDYELCCRRLKDDRAKTFWMAGHDKPYQLEVDTEHKLFYLRYNQVVSQRELPLEAYLNAVVDEVSKQKPEAFVLDLRQNAGGNGTLNPMTIKHLLRIEALLPENRFFVLISRNTFSAAMMLSSLISQYTDAIFIGEPTGSSPNFTGENDIVMLPNTGLMVSLSSRHWHGSMSEDQRHWLAPDVSVPLSSEAFFAGRDPVMEEVRLLMKTNLKD